MQHKERPKKITTLNDLEAYYWLKRDLMCFCREHGLSSSGLKNDLIERIRYFLLHNERPVVPNSSHKHKSWDSDGVITVYTPVKNYKNDAKTRAFFVSQIGVGFKFNHYLRQFTKPDNITEGLTYGDLVAGYYVYEANKLKKQQDIPKQFEYNQFIRDFFRYRPDGSLLDAVAAWNYIKAHPGPNTHAYYLQLLDNSD